jgi:predicted amidophosphoribosyltransferase
MECEMNTHTTVRHGSARAHCSRCRRPVEMARFVDPRAVDTRPPEEKLRDWDPYEPRLAPTIYKCTRCGHEAHTPATAA